MKLLSKIQITKIELFYLILYYLILPYSTLNIKMASFGSQESVTSYASVATTEAYEWYEGSPEPMWPLEPLEPMEPMWSPGPGYSYETPPPVDQSENPPEVFHPSHRMARQQRGTPPRTASPRSGIPTPQNSPRGIPCGMARGVPSRLRRAFTIASNAITGNGEAGSPEPGSLEPRAKRCCRMEFDSLQCDEDPHL